MGKQAGEPRVLARGDDVEGYGYIPSMERKYRFGKGKGVRKREERRGIPPCWGEDEIDSACRVGERSLRSCMNRGTDKAGGSAPSSLAFGWECTSESAVVGIELDLDLKEGSVKMKAYRTTRR